MKTYHTTILVIESDPSYRKQIEWAFRGIGVVNPIQLLSDGEEAIAYMCGEGKFADREKYAYPTFIMTDLDMPGQDGFAVLAFLKKNPMWKVIPVVVLADSYDLHNIKTAYTLGASSYHVKPGTLEGLCAQLKILNDYWLTCEVPQVDSTGKQLWTHSKGTLGEKYTQEWERAEAPHR